MPEADLASVNEAAVAAGSASAGGSSPLVAALAGACAAAAVMSLGYFLTRNSHNEPHASGDDDGAAMEAAQEASPDAAAGSFSRHAPPAHKPFKQQFKYDNLLFPRYFQLIGETPMLDLSHHVRNRYGNRVKLLAKAEFFQPGFSVKDRIVRHILLNAEASGKLKPGMTVVAASSGNTGAATAMMCAMRGYRCLITTSPKCSQEKMDAIRAYGAQLLVSPSGVSSSDPRHYMQMARRVAKANPEAFFDVDQYDTALNAEAHYRTLGPEIWRQTAGQVTHFVCAASTGGTISGTGKFLKEQSGGRVQVVLADPRGSIFYDYFQTGKHGKMGNFLVEGVGKGSIPGAMDFDVVDDCIQGSDSDAFNMCRKLAEEDGMLVGGSGGFNVFGALQVANNLKEDGVVVTLFPDSGIKYLSKVYSDDWLSGNDIVISRHSQRRVARVVRARDLAQDIAKKHDFELVGASSSEDDDDDDDEEQEEEIKGAAAATGKARAQDEALQNGAPGANGKAATADGTPPMASKKSSRRGSLSKDDPTSKQIQAAMESASAEAEARRQEQADRDDMMSSTGGTSKRGVERYYTRPEKGKSLPKKK